jgi:hypothetical protein
MAVSAVTLRLPLTISLMRLGGTLISKASLFWLNASGFKNCSRRISPGWTGAILFSLIMHLGWNDNDSMAGFVNH